MDTDRAGTPMNEADVGHPQDPVDVLVVGGGWGGADPR